MTKSPTRKANQIIYEWNSIIEKEAKSFDQEDLARRYRAIVNVFPIPPKGCEEQAYLRARDRTAYILHWWKNKLEPTASGEKLREIISDPFLKAIVIFEMTNFLIAARIQDPFTFSFEGERIFQFFLSPTTISKNKHKKIDQLIVNIEKNLTDLLESWKGLVPHNPNHLQETLKFLGLVRSANKEHSFFAQLKTIQIFSKESFQSIRLPKHARLPDILMGLLAFRLREALYAAGNLSDRKTYALLVPLFNSMFDLNKPEKLFKMNVAALQKKADNAKNLLKSDIIYPYKAILMALPVNARTETTREMNSYFDRLADQE